MGMALMVAACQSPKAPITYQVLRGDTMGTTYNVVYFDTLKRDLQPAIDSLLLDVNASMSTYIDSSLISQFNRFQDTSPVVYHRPAFCQCVGRCGNDVF